jgi:hypothetical protein
MTLRACLAIDSTPPVLLALSRRSHGCFDGVLRLRHEPHAIALDPNEGKYVARGRFYAMAPVGYEAYRNACYKG